MERRFELSLLFVPIGLFYYSMELIDCYKSLRTVKSFHIDIFISDEFFKIRLDYTD
jgi:hypothetical protein